MTTVAYFISPHGFGHASRATAVMQALQRIEPDIQFLVFTSVPEWFFSDQGIQGLSYIHLFHDVGLVQATPFVEDLPATLQQLDEIYPYPVNVVHSTVAQLKQAKVDLVICDISPLGLVAARQSGIPSLLIENFTWDWIYRPFTGGHPQFQEFIDQLVSLFPLADHHIQVEPICERNPALPRLEQLISRSFRTPAPQIRNALNLTNGEKMVLISFGGIRNQFTNLDFLQPYKNTVFVVGGVSETLQREGNVIFLPHHSPFYHPDLVQAADLIIGKAGYSTLAEVVLAGKPFAFISRENNIESAVLANYINQHLPSIEIDQESFLNRSWIDQLPAIMQLEPTSPAAINGAALVAEYILTEIL